MNIVGIICEYNPFHNGHAAHIEKTRALLPGDEAVICVMSGNFVQRGEPAAFSKHVRAEAAVRGGADLVIELPLPWATASAGRFAFGGVSILAALGVPVTLSFACEHGDGSAISRTAEALSSPEADALIREFSEEGLPYASAMQKAADALMGPEAELLKEPNNLLGVEYLKAARALGADITPLTFPRFGADHDGLPSGRFASASYLRECVTAGVPTEEYVPPAAAELYAREIRAGRAPASLPEAAMLYRLRTMADGEYAALPDGTEGLWNRLAKHGRKEPSLSAVLENSKTKRYALSRLRRMVLAAFLGVTAEMQNGAPPYLRVLAAGPRGREALAQIKHTSSLPIITKPASAKKLPEAARKIFELEARASDLYALCFPAAPGPGGAEWKTNPVIPE